MTTITPCRTAKNGQDMYNMFKIMHRYVFICVIGTISLLFIVFLPRTSKNSTVTPKWNGDRPSKLGSSQNISGAFIHHGNQTVNLPSNASRAGETSEKKRPIAADSHSGILFTIDTKDPPKSHHNEPSHQAGNLANNFTYPPFIRRNTALSRVLPVGSLTAGICKSLNNIALLKTHKCSSSTVQNVLYRWGENHNLTFILPKSDVYFGHPQPFDIRMAQRVPGDKYNILANHARYNEKGLKKALPNDTVYITILRQPHKQFESAFTYYRFDIRYAASSLKKFLQQPEVYFQSEPVNPRHPGRNQMLYDLGMDARFKDEQSPEVRSHIDKIDRNFQLVLIAEYFEESVVLLKDMLCWSLEDVIYFSQNTRSPSSVRKVTPEMRDQIRNWNSADYSLYKHFNRTFWHKVELYGRERMQNDVQHLRQLNSILAQKCIGGKLNSHDPRMWYPQGIKVNSFILNPDVKNDSLCQQLTMPEPSYLKHLRARQAKRFHIK